MVSLDGLPVAREDFIFVIMVLGIVLGVFLFNSSGNGNVPQYCKDWAASTQENLSKQYGDVSCNCISGEKYKDRLDTPKKVQDASDLNLLQCDVNGQKILFPVWRVNNSKVMGNASGAQVVE